MTRDARSAADKVVAREDLAELLRPVRDGGKTVVFTNGCYDILHAGHLRLLETAAGYGDLLVVALNHDDSVRRLKGRNRPWVRFEERALLVAGLEAVDWVTGFGEDTPAEIVDLLVPDVLVKGGDWSPDRIVGRETVERNGGRVVTVPLVEDRSTSSLVERIRCSPT